MNKGTEMTDDTLRELLAKARYWRCTRDELRCADGNGCECEIAGDADPLPELRRLAIRELPALLADRAELAALREAVNSGRVSHCGDCRNGVFAGKPCEDCGGAGYFILLPASVRGEVES